MKHASPACHPNETPGKVDSHWGRTELARPRRHRIEHRTFADAAEPDRAILDAVVDLNQERRGEAHASVPIDVIPGRLSVDSRGVIFLVMAWARRSISRSEMIARTMRIG